MSKKSTMRELDWPTICVIRNEVSARVADRGLSYINKYVGMWPLFSVTEIRTNIWKERAKND